MIEYSKERLKVNRTDRDEHEFIVEYDGTLFRIPQFPCQWGEEQPDNLPCIIRRKSDGKIFIEQDIEAIVSSYYSVGDEAEFRIELTKGGCHELRDARGFKAKIEKWRVPNPALTPRLRCRIAAINHKGLQVELMERLADSERDFTLTGEQLRRYCGASAGQAWDIGSLSALLRGDKVDSVPFDFECHRWLARQSLAIDRELLVESLATLRQSLLEAVENSDMLDECPLDERRLMEGRITHVVEQAAYYIDAAAIVANGEQDSCIASNLDRLDRSGYVFHPRQNFYTMLFVFRTDADCMARHMPRALDILRRRGAAFWKREPFRALWIGMLEHYIRHNNNRPDSLLSGDGNDNDTAACTLRALLWQQSLADDTDGALFDATLNRSILYRLSSQMGVVEPRRLLEQSLYNLFTGDDTQPFASDYDDAALNANKIASQCGDTLAEGHDATRFTAKGATLLVAGGRVELTAPEVTKDDNYTPNALHNLWHGLTITTPDKPPVGLRTEKLGSIRRYKELWAFLWQQFFDAKPKAAKRKKPLLDDEEVEIVVRRRLEGDMLFECEVVSEDHEGTTGTLNAKDDIVHYFPGAVDISHFEHEGRPLILPAVARKSADGSYWFTMTEMIDQFFDDYQQDNLNFNSLFVCQLNTARGNNRRTPGISELGMSVSVGFENEEERERVKGKVVEVRGGTMLKPPYINAEFVCEMPDRQFSTVRAFHNLLVLYADSRTLTAAPAEPEEAPAQTMAAAYATELMATIEAYAAGEDDHFMAYNYIAVCRIIAHMLGSQREQYYERRLALIELLGDFAANNALTAESLAKLDGYDGGEIAGSQALGREYRKMKIVSYQDTDDHQDELFQASTDRSDTETAQLASLVMAHNCVKQAGMLAQADAILEKIRAILRLPSSKTDKRFYGKEDFHTEFKTSIVYPESSMRPDIVAQTYKIMAEIAAMLNADGGTLYLGVNDQGYECGLDEDLRYPQFAGSQDKYEDYINNSVAAKLTQMAAHHVHTRWIDDGKEKVLAIAIDPCPTAIALDGDYYERMGKSCRRVKPDYLPDFLGQHQAPAAPVAAPAARQPAAAPQPKTAAAKPSEAPNPINTSRMRANVIHDYEEGYEPAEGYICFLGHDEYKILNADDYRTEDYRLELAVHSDEADAWLVMAYTGGALVRVKMAELLGRQPGKLFKRYDGSELLFATIAKKGDIVAVGYINGKGNRHIRFNELTDIAEGNMQACGATLCDAGNATFYYIDVVPRDKLPEGAVVGEKRTTLGVVLATVKGKQIARQLPGAMD